MSVRQPDLPAALLRGRRFFVAPVGIGAMRLAIFKANISKNGGIVVKLPTDGETDYFLAEKACEGSPAADKVAQLWKSCTGGKSLKSLHWMEDLLSGSKWIDTEHELPKHSFAMKGSETPTTPSTDTPPLTPARNAASKQRLAAACHRR